MNIYLKFLITAVIIVAISEVAKLNDKLGSLLASLPLMTFLTLFWLHFEHQPTEKIANHAYYTFWYVLPTLPMFLIFPYLLQRLGFWGAIGSSILLTVLCFFLMAGIVKKFGIGLI